MCHAGHAKVCPAFFRIAEGQKKVVSSACDADPDEGTGGGF